MREINEQWIEEGSDGKMHMYKAVEGIHCSGCCYDEGDRGCYISGLGCPTDNGETDLVVRDLGPVNEDGCLAEERTGLFPVVENRFHNLWAVTVSIDDFVKNVQVTCYGDTKQQAIDAWNRRT